MVKFGHGLRPLWLLEPDMYFLNHGSFGATPRTVLAAQQTWRERMENQPVRFMSKELPTALREAAAALAQYLGTAGENLVFVDNATTGINTVLRSIAWRAGDELVLCRHAYPAVKNAARFIAGLHDITIREANVPFPLKSADDIVQAFSESITTRTRLVIVDHLSSPLALIYPIAPIIAMCRERGIAVLVDGAHGPGMLSLELDALGADWYVGNCHKWLCAPKGCGFLWAAPHAQAALNPLVISLKWNEGFLAEFDWTGTRDPTAWLAITAALEFNLILGAEQVRAYNHDLVIDAARELAVAWGVSLPAPESMFGAMVTLPLPIAEKATQTLAEKFHDALWRNFHIEVPVLCFDDRLWTRLSGQVYNEQSDYMTLAEAVPRTLLECSDG